MRILFFILIGIAISSCNSQKDYSLFQNENGEFIDIKFSKQKVLPGLQSALPYTQYTITLTPAVEGTFEVRDENDKSVKSYFKTETRNGIESNVINFNNSAQQFNEDELILVWNDGNRGLFSKLPKPDPKDPIALP